jgi:hypothetical protein
MRAISSEHSAGAAEIGFGGAETPDAAPNAARVLRVSGLRGLDSRSDWRPETTGHHRSPAGRDGIGVTSLPASVAHRPYKLILIHAVESLKCPPLLADEGLRAGELIRDHPALGLNFLEPVFQPPAHPRHAFRLAPGEIDALLRVGFEVEQLRGRRGRAGAHTGEAE